MVLANHIFKIYLLRLPNNIVIAAKSSLVQYRCCLAADLHDIVVC
jgi:hypothetical protein